MNRKNLIATVAAIAAATLAGQAFAESPNAFPEPQFVGSKTRAQVQAELGQYKAAGVNYWSSSYNPLVAFKSTASRDQVRADYIASRDEVAALTAEGGTGYPVATQRPATANTRLASQPAATLR